MKDFQYVKAYTIKEVSRKINVPSGTIRQWEKDLNGLLVIPRTRQGARFYTDKEIEDLKTIKEMRSKNLSKEMIRELMQKHATMENKSSQNEMTAVPPTPKGVETPQDIIATPLEMNMDLLFDALENYKLDLISGIRKELKSGKEELVEEVKKEITTGSMETVKALSMSIQRSNMKTKKEVGKLTEQIKESSERTSEMFVTVSAGVTKAAAATERVGALADQVSFLSKGTKREFSTLTDNLTKITSVTKKQLEKLADNLVKLSKGSSKDVAVLSENVSKLSTGTNKQIASLATSIHKLANGTSKEMTTLSAKVTKLSEGASEEMAALSSRMEETSEEFRLMTDYLSESKETINQELSSLNEQLLMDREYYIESLKMEREQFRQEIQQRDEVFKNLVLTFRETASAKDGQSAWWKFWGK
ncbi:MerR family transcriptional regulator [Bacillus massilinigeriensis]|uniref:MerR family transcriptional regulator n=1 Tax=Bacillus mediterraneensis TaxID=1805474 RepID=UPI0008F96B56|nr:MerR family transcriptional regulator [Bacillus mediterraneensis]